MLIYIVVALSISVFCSVIRCCCEIYNSYWNSTSTLEFVGTIIGTLIGLAIPTLALIFAIILL